MVISSDVFLEKIRETFIEGYRLGSKDIRNGVYFDPVIAAKTFFEQNFDSMFNSCAIRE